MTLLTEKGTFVKETSNVDGTDQTINLVNSSLTPKVLWLWTTGQTANATYAEDWMVSYGFSDGTDDACIAAASEDNETACDAAGIIRNDAVCVILDATTTPTTINAQADVVSFNAGNFVLNWAVSDATASIIHYMVAGGTDITNAKVVSRTITDGTGASSYTDVGFQGDFVNFLTCASGQSVNTAATLYNFVIGAATSSSAQWLVGGSAENAAGTSDVYHFKRNNNCMNQWSSTTGTQNGLAAFTGFTSNGFDLNYSDNWVLTTDRMAYLVIKGGVWNVGSGTAPSTATSQTINTTSSTTPASVMMFTWGTTGSNSGTTGDADFRMAIGGADSALHEGCISTHDTDNAINMINTRISLDTKIIRAHTANATATSSTTVAEADITDMDNDGNFVITWTTTLNAMGYNWFAVSAGVSTTPVSETSIHKYNLLANATQTSIHKYNLAAYIAQTSIEKYNIVNNIAQTSIHKYNLLQNALQTSIHKYNMIGNALQTSIQKYNILQNILHTSIHKYDILNTVPPATSVHKYDLRQNIVQASIHKYNLFKDILQTSIHKYNLIAYIAQTNIHKYNLAAYIAQQSIHKYNMLAYVLQNSIHKYNMDGLVAALSKHKYDILNTIAQTSKHKYDILNTIAQTSIHKYNLLANVLQSSIHKYSLLNNVLQSSIQKYNLIAYTLQSSIHKYHLFQNIVQTSIHKYDLEVLGAVVNALIAKYNILAYVTQPSIHKYNLLQNVAQTSIHKYNLLVNVLRNSIQKYDVLQNVLELSIHKYTLLQNVVLSSIHKYDIIAEALTVLANSIHKYNILNTIAQTSKHKYDLLNTVARTSIHKYNILQQILQSSIHKYGMGGIVTSQSKHLYNIIREILGSSVAGGVAGKIRPRIIRYPVYRIQEQRKLELRRRLRGTESVVIPAFKWNIHKTIAPFIVTNPVTGRVTVKFAMNKAEPVTFNPQTPVPVSIPAKTLKNAANKAKSAHVMQQKTIERYGKKLNKLSKIMTLFFLHEQLKDD